MLMLCFAATIEAQTFTAKTPPSTTTAVRGQYGTYQSYGNQSGQICSVYLGTVTPVASGKLDTLTNVDTGYVQFNILNNLGLDFDYTVTKISGTVAGTALLQGSYDNQNWITITGNTTYAAGYSGASATITNTAGTKHYHWSVPQDVAPPFPYWQVQAITSGTMTASYNCTVKSKY